MSLYIFILYYPYLHANQLKGYSYSVEYNIVFEYKEVEYINHNVVYIVINIKYSF
jgi:hypothetical protein